MTVRLQVLIAVVFLAVGVCLYWATQTNVEGGLAELAACKKQCSAENKDGQLVPYSALQISKRGTAVGPLKCQCV
jgi:hypothetical protein